MFNLFFNYKIYVLKDDSFKNKVILEKGNSFFKNYYYISTSIILKKTTLTKIQKSDKYKIINIILNNNYINIYNTRRKKDIEEFLIKIYKYYGQIGEKYYIFNINNLDYKVDINIKYPLTEEKIKDSILQNNIIKDITIFQNDNNSLFCIYNNDFYYYELNINSFKKYLVENHNILILNKKDTQVYNNILDLNNHIYKYHYNPKINYKNNILNNIKIINKELANTSNIFNRQIYLIQILRIINEIFVNLSNKNKRIKNKEMEDIKKIIDSYSISIIKDIYNLNHNYFYIKKDYIIHFLESGLSKIKNDSLILFSLMYLFDKEDSDLDLYINKIFNKSISNIDTIDITSYYFENNKSLIEAIPNINNLILNLYNDLNITIDYKESNKDILKTIKNLLTINNKDSNELTLKYISLLIVNDYYFYLENNIMSIYKYNRGTHYNYITEYKLNIKNTNKNQILVENIYLTNSNKSKIFKTNKYNNFYNKYFINKKYNTKYYSFKNIIIELKKDFNFTNVNSKTYLNKIFKNLVNNPHYSRNFINNTDLLKMYITGNAEIQSLIKKHPNYIFIKKDLDIYSTLKQ